MDEYGKALSRMWNTLPKYQVRHRDPEEILFTRDLWNRQLPKKHYKAVPQLADLCESIVKTNIPLESGYSIKFQSYFKFQEKKTKIRRTRRGLNLVILNPEGKHVGGLTFKIGFPLEIISVHGNAEGNLELPREFYRKTGKLFWMTLIDTFIEAAGKHVTINGNRKRPIPKVIFRFEEPKMDLKLARSIVRNYCPTSQLQKLGLQGRIKLGDRFRLREKFLARVRRRNLRR